jgi:hypothetical protein
VLASADLIPADDGTKDCRTTTRAWTKAILSAEARFNRTEEVPK